MEGVPLVGAGLASKLTTREPNITILRRIGAPVSGKGFFRDFSIDGAELAKTCLEMFGGTYDEVQNVSLQRAHRPLVIDASQNLTLRNVAVERATEYNITVLNGAGSVTFDHCWANFGGIGHVYIGNDPNYPGWELGPGTFEELNAAYRVPSLIKFVGGVYERELVAGRLRCSIRIDVGENIIAQGGTEFWAASTSETIVDNGRFRARAAFSSPNSFVVTGTNALGRILPGRLVRVYATDVYDGFGVIEAVSERGQGTVAVTVRMGDGESIPLLTSWVEFGRSDDLRAWHTTGKAEPRIGPSATRLRDVYFYGGELKEPSIRNGGENTIIDGAMFLACHGDWVETGETINIIRPNGTLRSGRLVARHILGEAVGRNSIIFDPLAGEQKPTQGRTISAK
ncbi:hypothetical protein [Microvirga sp. TS319]|uniref:hypothetical protein n=1 Tax=Microvirga sp. TS319 TaxID=3241165 RepID=UPI00351A9AED